MRDDLPETPEPVVKFFYDTYLDNFRYKPQDSIISERQMRAFLDENGIELDKCTIIQRPKTNTYEALIKGRQIYRIHYVIECKYDEEKCVVIIPKTARLFLEEIYKATEENSLTALELTHSIDPWQNSWIHKRISYSEFRAHALCNQADAILDGFDGKVNEVIEKNISLIKNQLNKQMENLRNSLFTQHGALLKDVKQFEDRVKKSLTKPKETVKYETIIKELTKKNESLMKTVKNDKLYMTVLFVVQLFIVGLVLVHMFSVC
jgi:hypothetical protein